MGKLLNERDDSIGRLPSMDDSQLNQAIASCTGVAEETIGHLESQERSVCLSVCAIGSVW